MATIATTKMKVTNKEWFTALQDRPFSIMIRTIVSVPVKFVSDRKEEDDKEKEANRNLQPSSSSVLSIDVGSLECTKWPMAQLLHCLSLLRLPTNDTNSGPLSAVCSMWLLPLGPSQPFFQTRSISISPSAPYCNFSLANHLTAVIAVIFIHTGRRVCACLYNSLSLLSSSSSFSSFTTVWQSVCLLCLPDGAENGGDHCLCFLHWC